jgi:hypothetical protein
MLERNTSQVTLSGVVSSPEPKQAIQAALSGTAYVRLNLTMLTASAANDTPIRQDAGSKPVPMLYPTFDRASSPPGERLAFINRCLDASDTAPVHAWALKRLADARLNPDRILTLFAAAPQVRDVTNEQNLAQVSAEFRSNRQAIHSLLGSLK